MARTRNRPTDPGSAAVRDPGPDLSEALARYRAALPEGEAFFEFSVAAVDPARPGIHVWSCLHLPGKLGGGDGYGAGELEARVGTLGEQHETLQSELLIPALPTERGSYADLVAAWGEEAVLDPALVGLPAGSRYTPELPRRWVRARRWREDRDGGDGGEVWTLLEAASSSGVELPDGYQPLFLPVTNGLGAGLSVERALEHALFEILQRDGNSVAYRAFDRGRWVDVPSEAVAEAGVEEVLAGLRAGGVDPVVKLAATDFGTVDLYVHGRGAAPESAPMVLAAGGEACGVDRGAALRKALLEFAASRARLAFFHGPLADAARIASPGYLEAHRAHFELLGGVAAEERRALDGMRRWLELGPTALERVLEPIWSRRERVAWEALPADPDLAAAPPGAKLAAVGRRLADAGFGIVWLELATPRAAEHGVRAVKALVPGLEVETASYARIGERNLRRLLERDPVPAASGGPLVGLGAPPPGAARVHLTAAAEERLGGPGWLHPERLRAFVGELYPIYREPGPHALRYALGE